MTDPEQSMSFHSQAKLGDDCFAAPRGKTILVVDDYSSFCAVIAAMLRPRGYHVLVASSGEEASAIAAREDENRSTAYGHRNAGNAR